MVPYFDFVGCRGYTPDIPSPGPEGPNWTSFIGGGGGICAKTINYAGLPIYLAVRGAR